MAQDGTVDKCTLCVSCHIEIFKLCPFVHYEGRIKGMKTKPIFIRGSGLAEKVVECPKYVREVGRDIL